MLCKRVPTFRTANCRVVALLFACLAGAPALAEEKPGMPDLAQVEQTCLPTSTANLILWFGHHGYPKLIPAGANEDERDLHVVHRLMVDTDARFDWGTRFDEVTLGIGKYIRDAGYNCTVEYRGLEGQGAPFTQSWLKENDGASEGFILLLAYCRLDPQTHTFTPAWNAGHAVTLVNVEPDMLLVHDPAHMEDESGRKILTPSLISSGTWRDRSGISSVDGLLLLSGSLLEAPPNSLIMVAGAVCITMNSPGAKKSATQLPVAMSSRPTAKSRTWMDWLFGLIF